jgi:hypothetical protein
MLYHFKDTEKKFYNVKQPSLMIKSNEIAYLISKPNTLDHFKDTEKKFTM